MLPTAEDFSNLMCRNQKETKDGNNLNSTIEKQIFKNNKLILSRSTNLMDLVSPFLHDTDEKRQGKAFEKKQKEEELRVAAAKLNLQLTIKVKSKAMNSHVQKEKKDRDQNVQESYDKHVDKSLGDSNLYRQKLNKINTKPEVRQYIQDAIREDINYKGLKTDRSENIL